MERGFELAPVVALSYNDFTELYGGSVEDFSLHSLAYMLQCRQNDIDDHTRVGWESRLVGTRYDARTLEDDKAETL
ncbi:hypothetical protein UFOVP585_57 [uncultured Caudovirales phage]|uniref:Uncharacterized protein n=1 Tax=uncultured Caudovirales phage TaxID=2100421 RepID=A0A6J5N939_9CAUD|nr:hypothetical protein UFOVP585_57 [uncultured Caudovirales phage]